MCILGATILWSAIPICVKLALSAYDPYTLVLIRLIITTSAFAAAILPSIIRDGWQKTMAADRRDIPWLVVGGLGMGGNYVLYFVGLEFTTASAANLIVQIEVVALILLGWLILHEPMGRAKVGGIVLTLAGVGLVFWNGESFRALAESKNLLGNLIVFISGPIWALYGLAQKVLAHRRVSDAAALVYIFTIATVISIVPVPFAYERRGPVTPVVIAAMLILSLLGTAFAYFLLARAFRVLQASTVATTASILPIFTIIEAAIFLGERIAPVAVAGAVLVVSGIAIVSRAEYGTSPN